MDGYGFVAFFSYPWLAESRSRAKEMPISKVKALDTGQLKKKKQRPEVWGGPMGGTAAEEVVEDGSESAAL